MITIGKHAYGPVNFNEMRILIRPEKDLQPYKIFNLSMQDKEAKEICDIINKAFASKGGKKSAATRQRRRNEEN